MLAPIPYPLHKSHVSPDGFKAPNFAEIHVPSFTNDDVDKRVNELAGEVTVVHLPVFLERNPVPPWGAGASKEVRDKWTDDIREVLSDPENYDIATPQNIGEIVCCYLYIQWKVF